MNVILKYNKDTPKSKFCLKRWLDIFKYYRVTILTDITANYDGLDISTVRFANSNDSHSNSTHLYGIDTRYKGHTVANLTSYDISDEMFWLIDADDTVLTMDTEVLRDKFKLAEQYFINNQLDGFSLDFYREKCDQWSFGVALLKNMDLSMTKTVTIKEITDRGLEHNMDCVFDILRLRGDYKLESFVFEDAAFTHYIDYWEGSYYWRNNMNWNEPLANGVVTIK